MQRLEEALAGVDITHEQLPGGSAIGATEREGVVLSAMDGNVASLSIALSKGASPLGAPSKESFS